MEVVVAQMKVVDGALWTRTTSRFDVQGYARYVNGTWAGEYSNWPDGGDIMHVGGWYPRSNSNHLLLGGGGSSEYVPMCKQWTGVWPLIDCTTTRVTSASAQLRNGTIVLAESDYFRFEDRTYETPPSGYVEGGFGLRFPDGREIPLAGDPGNTTKFVVAEAHRNAAWAVTTTYTGTGYKHYLQRYDG